MRNQLFKSTVSRGDRLVVGHVVAPEEQRAMEIVTQSEIEGNREPRRLAGAGGQDPATR